MSEVSQGRLPIEEEGIVAPEKREQPGAQERPMNDEEDRDESLDDTFPASDPVPPKQIDGPNN